jgi:hypothetical protein
MRGAGALSTTPEGRHIPAPRRETPPSADRTPPAAPGSAVDDQLRRLEARLLAEAEGDADLEQSLRLHLAQACAHFATATVRQFLPILVEREVRRRLAAQ